VLEHFRLEGRDRNRFRGVGDLQNITRAPRHVDADVLVALARELDQRASYAEAESQTRYLIQTCR
jgi:hypothetical protein